MSDVPLRIRNIPREDFADAIAQLIETRVKPGCVHVVEVGHHAQCPCQSGLAPMGECTCPTVDLTLAVRQ